MKISHISSVLSAALLLAVAQQSIASPHGGGHHVAKHTVGLFLGAVNTVVANEKTHKKEDKSETAYGLEYEYRFNDAFGLGVVYETAPDGHHELGESTQLLTGNWHPNNNWRLTLGFGKVSADSGTVDGHHIPEVDESVTRLGAAYDIHLGGGWGLAPTLNFDLIDSETIEVYGIVLNKGF